MPKNETPVKRKYVKKSLVDNTPKLESNPRLVRSIIYSIALLNTSDKGKVLQSIVESIANGG